MTLLPLPLIVFISQNDFVVAAPDGVHLPEWIIAAAPGSMFTWLFLLQLSLVLCYQASGDIWYLIEMEGFGFASVLTMVFAGQVYLRYKEPNLHRPIKVRGYLLRWLWVQSIIIMRFVCSSHTVLIPVNIGSAYITTRLVIINTFNI